MRAVPVAAAALLLGLATVQPAVAADATTVVHGLDELPSDLGFGLRYASCTTPGQRFPQSPGPVAFAPGPGTAPLGERTWGFAPAHPGGAIGPFRHVPAIRDLTAAQVQVYADGAGTDGVAYADVLADDSGTVSWWGVSPPFHVAGGSWQTANALGRTFSWVQVGGTGATFSGTVDEMVDLVGSDHGGFVGLGFGCGDGDSFHLDDAAFGGAGDVLTLDLEGPLTLTTIEGSAPVAVAGGAVTLSGVTTESGGTPLETADLVLQAEPYGDTTWHDVGSATETYDTSQHPALHTARPLVRTSYRWVYAGTPTFAGSASPAFVVGVHTAVTAHAVDPTVRHGRTISVAGRMTPAKPGTRVRLLRGDTVVGRAVVRDSGRYSISTVAAHTGTWHLHVRVRAASGNLAGESPVLDVRVR